MIITVKRFCSYFSAAFAFAISVLAVLSTEESWSFLFLLSMTIAILCAFVAWKEANLAAPPLRSRPGESLTLAVIRARTEVMFGARDDESIAMEANNIVRKTLDKKCIEYKAYKEWRQKNNLVFSAITDGEKHLIGFFDVFPLTQEAGKALIEGKLAENELTINSILPFEDTDDAKIVYIASIMVNPYQRVFSKIVAKEVVLHKFAEFMMSTFPPQETRYIIAYARTNEGENLLRNNGFINTLLKKDSKQHDPLYELPPNGYSDLSKMFKEVLTQKILRRAKLEASKRRNKR